MQADLEVPIVITGLGRPDVCAATTRGALSTASAAPR